MGDRFVDVSYRGLEVGRQLKLRDVTTEGGYLESSTPMPVGSPLEVVIDDGTRLAAVVAFVHEHVGGAAVTAGMQIRPVASDAAARHWWEAQPEPVVPSGPSVIDAPRVTAATPPAIIDVAPVVAIAPGSEDAPSSDGGDHGDGASAPLDAPAIQGVQSVADAIPTASLADVSSTGELEAIDVEDDTGESSASRPIATGANGHGDKPKKKAGKRRKRNTR